MAGEASATTSVPSRRWLSRQGQTHRCTGSCTVIAPVPFHARYFAESRRRIYVTPKSYLTLIDNYMGLMAAKRTELTLSRQRCMTGVTKIEDSNAMVAKLKVCVVRCTLVLAPLHCIPATIRTLPPPMMHLMVC